MKKTIILCIATLTAAALLCGCAQPAAPAGGSTDPEKSTEPIESTAPAENTEPTDAAAADWYELSSSDTVLTIRLPGNATTGYEWNYSISDPKILELLTQEYVEDDHAEDMVGVGGTYVGSFKGTFEAAGNVTLTLNYERSGDTEPAESRVLELFVDESNTIQVVSAKIVDGAATK